MVYTAVNQTAAKEWTYLVESFVYEKILQGFFPKKILVNNKQQKNFPTDRQAEKIVFSDFLASSRMHGSEFWRRGVRGTGIRPW